MADDEITWVTDDICTCNNCGAFAEKPELIRHYKNCRPGESKKWENFYSENKEEAE